MHIKVWISALLIINTLSFSVETEEQNSTQNITIKANITTQDENSTNTIITSVKTKDRIEIEKLHKLIEATDKELLENNIWSKIYSNYHTYKVLQAQKTTLDTQITKLEHKKYLKESEQKELEHHKEQKVTLLGKLQLLEEYEEDPFKKFLTPEEIEAIPDVGNPFAVIGALSYQKKLTSDQEDYNARYQSLTDIMDKLLIKQKFLKQILLLDKNSTEVKKDYTDNEDQIKTFEPVLEIFKTTNNVYSKKIDEIKLNLKNTIKKEVEKTITIGAVILFFILLLLLIKYFVRKYMSNNDRYYTINKALNITFVIFLLLTLLLGYLENVSYLVTILGFASAGIAIAMKDWFMSLMGWLTIVIGGSIHVGDRVKFVRNGVEYVGDIVDISILRMTMHEDITLTTTIHNRRAGRIIFIPNNFIFTDMFSNYAHAGLKTVWDGIDFMVTFDSDIHKASQIAKEITKKYSKGYTDITRKQLNKLRSQYSMKNTNVEPRIFTFIEPYGMKISSWYLTNSYATLTLRSTISAEIIARIQAEENVHLAFPTQSIYVDKDVRKPNVELTDQLPQGGLY